MIGGSAVGLSELKPLVFHVTACMCMFGLPSGLHSRVLGLDFLFMSMHSSMYVKHTHRSVLFQALQLQKITFL